MNQRASMDLLRAGLPITLYATTEAHVFVQLLLYRIFPSYYTVFHFISSYLYVGSRLFALVLTFICYVEWMINYGGFITSNDMFDIGFGYVIFFYYVGIANLGLNFVQFTSMKALFYMSDKVYKHSKLRKQFKHTPRIQELYDIYTTYDDVNGEASNYNKNEWTLDDLDQFLQDYSDIFIKNAKISELMFESLLIIQSKKNFFKKRSKKKRAKVNGIKWKTFLWLFENELIYVSENFTTKHIVTEKINHLISGALLSFQTANLSVSIMNRAWKNSGKNSGKRHGRSHTTQHSGSHQKRTSLLSRLHSIGNIGHIGGIGGIGGIGNRGISLGPSIDTPEMQERVKVFSASIEKFNARSVDGIVNISRAHDKDEIISKISTVIEDEKKEKRKGCEFWCLFILRCVPCRYGCKCRYMLHELGEHHRLGIKKRTQSTGVEKNLANVVKDYDDVDLDDEENKDEENINIDQDEHHGYEHGHFELHVHNSKYENHNVHPQVSTEVTSGGGIAFESTQTIEKLKTKNSKLVYPPSKVIPNIEIIDKKDEYQDSKRDQRDEKDENDEEVDLDTMPPMLPGKPSDDPLNDTKMVASYFKRLNSQAVNDKYTD